MTDTNLTPDDLKKKNSQSTWDASGSPSPWLSLDLSNSSLVNTLESAKDSLVPVISAAKTILEIVKTIIEATLSVLVSAMDMGAQAVQAAINVVRDLLEDLLNVGSFYTLFVPIGRTDLNTTTKIMADAFLGGNPYPEELPFSGKDLLGSGGNYGFLKTVAESLQDTKDSNRPQFGQDAHIAAVAILFGSTNMYELYELVDKFLKALQIPGAKTSHNPTPQPKGLRATIVPSHMGIRDNIVGSGVDTDHPYAVKLEWNREDKVVDVDDAGNATSIKRIVIYRATHPDKLDPSQSPKRWAERELDSMLFDGITNSFFDNTIEPSTKYTYGVGFELAVEDSDGKELTTFVRTIKTVRVNTDNISVPATHGVPPDWSKHNLLDTLFPQVREFVELYLLKFLDSLESSMGDTTEALHNYVKFLEKEIKRYSDWVQNILDRIEDLIEALTWPNVYAGATLIYTDATLDSGGGNQFLINQLGKALTDTDIENRPPFDSGSEAVAGLVLMAGSESAGAIKRFKTFLETFIGSAKASSGSSFQQALDSIDYLAQKAEEQLCMSPMFEKTVCQETTPAQNSFDSAFEPAKERC